MLKMNHKNHALNSPLHPLTHMSMMTTNDGLVLDVANVVLENPYNDYEGLDTNFDLHESYMELDELDELDEVLYETTIDI